MKKEFFLLAIVVAETLTFDLKRKQKEISFICRKIAGDEFPRVIVPIFVFWAAQAHLVYFIYEYSSSWL